MRRATTALAALVLTGAAAVGCGGRQDAPSADTGGEITCEVTSDTRVAIATGNATGVYFSLGNAYAEQISAASDGTVKATAAETGASVQNIQQLVAGTYQVAFSLADSAADAVQGKASFDGKEQPVQALSRIYANYTQVIVAQRRRHRVDRRHARQAGFDRLAGLGHRSHRQPAAGSRRASTPTRISPRSDWISPRPSTA